MSGAYMYLWLCRLLYRAPLGGPVSIQGPCWLLGLTKWVLFFFFWHVIVLKLYREESTSVANFQKSFDLYMFHALAMLCDRVSQTRDKTVGWNGWKHELGSSSIKVWLLMEDQQVHRILKMSSWDECVESPCYGIVDFLIFYVFTYGL